MEKLFQGVAAFVVIMASTGQLPQLIRQVRVAQVHLIQSIKASVWGLPDLLKDQYKRVKLPADVFKSKSLH